MVVLMGVWGRWWALGAASVLLWVGQGAVSALVVRGTLQDSYGYTASRVAADGRTRVRVVLTPDAATKPLTYRLLNPDGSLAKDGGGLMLNSAAPATEVTTQGGSVSYVAPLGLGSPTAPGARELSIHVTSGVPSPIDEAWVVPFTLVRPPVALVHGFLSSSAVWTAAGLPEALDQAGYSADGAWMLDYAPTRTSGFATNLPAVQSQLLGLQALARSRELAFGGVDLVGHSMGGLLGRLYQQAPHSGGPELERMLTLDSPHFGSEWAGVIQFVPSGSALISQALSLPSDTQALKDLAPGSAALKGIKQVAVPSRAVVGISNAEGGDWRTGGTEDGESFLAAVTRQVLSRVMGWPPTTLAAIFGEESDLVVGATSQRGGLTGDFVTPLYQTTHTVAPTHARDALVALLTQSNPDQGFDPAGFPPVAASTQALNNALMLRLAGLLFGSVFAQGGVQAQQATPGLFQVLEPAPGAVVAAGDSVKVTLAPAEGVTLASVVVGLPDGSSVTLTQAPWEVTLKAPAKGLGFYPLMLVGFDTKAHLSVVTLPLTLVPTPAATSMAVLPASDLHLPAGASVPLALKVTLSDGQPRWVPGSDPGVTYAVGDANVLRISPNGVLSTLKAGQAQATASFQGFTQPVTIAVEGGAPASGDVNGDGSLTISDAVLALRMAVGIGTATPPQRAAADLDANGQTTVADVVGILRRVLGLG
ncbi:MAG TPA: dockerin type I domain-containing protein [Armatimonadota bacterium]|jgi:pimeloyl-ACP methyl ester carboxylesterase